MAAQRDEYVDDVPDFAARQYLGCFTTAPAQAELDQPVEAMGQHGHAAPPACGDDHVAGTPDSHFSPGCVCSVLHARCDGAGELQESLEEPGEAYVEVTLEQLRAASEAGCWFCSVIYGGFMAAPSWDPGRKVKNPPLPSFQLYSATAEGQDFFVNLFELRDPALKFYVREAEVKQHSLCKLFQVSPDLPSTTDVLGMLSFARSLNENCHRRHSCGNPASSFMPTRLLDIQVRDGKYVTKLVEKVPRQAYVALSHCWGRNMRPSAMTKAAVLDERMTDIPWEGLTQTFRDAVAMTERLGYRYLWIDSLCIVQDRQDDWEVEASRMKDVYSNCDLMLSADAATDGTVGFFRSARIASEPWVPQTRASTSGVRVCYGKIHRTFGIDVGMFISPEDSVHVRPLDTRAWCFQELHLAPRILHFGVDELYWDCLSEVRCQCGSLGPDGFVFTGSRKRHRELMESHCTVLDKTGLWLNTACQYSERYLTRWEDRLPALSGLAKQFLPSNPDASTAAQTAFRDRFDRIDLGDYLAGLWSRTLERDLCWYADYTPGKRLSTPQQYVGPSWSWVSVSGRVNWPDRGELESKIEVLGARCTPKGPDPTGRISYGEVILRGRLTRLFAFQGDVTARDGTRLVYRHLECRDRVSGELVSPGTFRPDSAPHLDGYRYCAGANHRTDNPNVRGADLCPITDGEYYGLQMANTYIMVVRLVSDVEPPVFERVGSIWILGISISKPDKSMYFEGIEARDIKLI